MLPVNVRGMWIGTFHGLCNRFLRAHWKLAALPQSFQILDMQDSQSAIKRIIKAMNLDEERFVAKQVSWFISGSKDDGRRPRDVEVRDEQSRKLVEIYQAYEDQCQREGVVDFAELMLRTYELLRDNDPLREHYQRRFRHVLVDEFQDTNRLQYAWLKMFAPPGRGDQARRRACSRSATTTRASMPSAAPRSATWPTSSASTASGRSSSWSRTTAPSATSSTAANALIAHNAQRLGKNLRTEAGPGEPVRVFESTSDYAEAQWLLEEMQALHRSGMARSEIALLYRSNAQSRVLESALFNAGIPYRVYGGLRFFERAEVKHALAYLRLIENPNDDTSFLRVVNFPTRGIGARTLELLQDAARASGRSLGQSVAAVAGKGGANLAGLRRAGGRDARRHPRADAARDHRPHAARRRACSTSTAPTRKARTASKTWKNWSTPPRPSSRRKASARTRWRCRWTSRAAARHRAASPRHATALAAVDLSPTPRPARSCRRWPPS